MKRLTITAKGATERWAGWQVASVCLLCLTSAACSPSAESDSTASARAEGQVVYFDVNLKSYLDRPIFDVFVGGRDVGVAGGPPHGGPGGLMTSVQFRLGPQSVSWRDAGTGATTKAVNQPGLTPDMAKHRYLGVHIYPDNTVELVPEDGWPEQTARGEEINRQWKASHGQ